MVERLHATETTGVSSVTGRFAGGLRADLKRRGPLFCSDWTDAFVPENLQKSVSTILYLFIAAIAPAITLPSSTYKAVFQLGLFTSELGREKFGDVLLCFVYRFASQGLVADSWMARTVSLECWRWSCPLPSVVSCLLHFQGSHCPFSVPLVLSWHTLWWSMTWQFRLSWSSCHSTGGPACGVRCSQSWWQWRTYAPWWSMLPGWMPANFSSVLAVLAPFYAVLGFCSYM